MAAMSSSHKYGRPIPLFVLAVIMGIIWFVVFLLRIQTSEALLLQESASYSPNWHVALQLIDLFRTQQTTAMVEAEVFAWVVAAIHLLIIVGWDIALTGLYHAADWLKKTFIVGTVLLIGYDIVSDFLWGALPGGTWAWGHFGFTAAMELGDLFFGIITVYLVIEAVTSVMHP